jgi:ankyrin repeat protein
MARNALALHGAYKRGDLAAVRRLLGNPPDFPNCRGPAGMGEIVLEYAIYHSPLAFIRALLDLGADPNYEDHAGFPALTATLTCGDRPDMHDILALLLAHGAAPNVHGFNDYTPLHDAVRMGDRRAVELLLAHGANPTVKTRIDDYETPLDIARALQVRREMRDILALLEAAIQV